MVKVELDRYDQLIEKETKLNDLENILIYIINNGEFRYNDEELTYNFNALEEYMNVNFSYSIDYRKKELNKEEN